MLGKRRWLGDFVRSARYKWSRSFASKRQAPLYARRSKFYQRKRRVRKHTEKTLHNPSPAVVPKAFRTKLLYTEVRDFTNVAGLDAYVYRGNSINDPNFTGAGGQPNGHDEWSALYGMYTVLGCKFEVMCDNHVAADTCYVTILPSYNSATLTDAINASGSSRALSVMLAADANHEKGLVGYASSKDILDCKDISDDVDNSAVFGNNPARAWYWHLYVQNLAGNANDMTVIVRMTFYCQLSVAKALNLS